MTYLLEATSGNYILKKLLGTGCTCKCYLGEKKSSSPSKDSETFAIKIINPKFHQYYSNEVNILSNFSQNDNIIKLYEHGQGYIIPFPVEENKENKEMIYYEVMEYAINGELKDYVQDVSTRIPENISAKIFYEIVSSVKYLHDNNIAHCDIKPENVLLNKNYRALLADFGFSRHFETNDHILHEFCGSEYYCGPEIKKAYTKGYDAMMNDAFSLGVLLFVITIGEFPFEMTTFSDQRYRHIIKKDYDRFWEYINQVETSDEFKDLINNLINITPSQRLEISQILEHPWVLKYANGENNNDNNLGNEDVIKELKSRK